MEVLPDLVAREPVIVFCGMAAAHSSRVREHYYESPGNSFWELMHLSGLSPRQLAPREDASVVELGLGLTDLVRNDDTDPPTYELDELIAKVRTWRPEILAFSSKTVAAVVARELGHRRPGLGEAGSSRALRPMCSLGPVGRTGDASTTAARTGSRGGATWPSWRVVRRPDEARETPSGKSSDRDEIAPDLRLYLRTRST